MHSQTITLLNTVRHLIDSRDATSTIALIDANLELLACYVTIPDDMAQAVTDPAALAVLAKMHLLRKQEELVIEYAVRALKADPSILDANTFYCDAIKFRLMEHLIGRGDRFVREYVLGLVDAAETTVSVLGYLHEIGENELLKHKLGEFLIRTGATEDVVALLRHLHPDAAEFVQNSPDLVHGLLAAPGATSDKLAIIGLLLPHVRSQKEWIRSLPANWQPYASFYAYNSATPSGKADLLPFVSPQPNAMLVDFMVLNSQTNFKFLECMGKASPFDFSLCNALMNAHTTNDTFYRTNRLSRSVDWIRFGEMAGLGLIHTTQPFEILAEVLPASPETGEAAALLSLGLISRNAVETYGHDPSLIRESEGYLTGMVSGDPSDECVLFGAYLALGILKFGTGDYDLFQRTRLLFEKYSTLAQETACYSIGLVYAGTNDMTVVEYLREIRRSTDFKRVIRVVNLALGMITGMGSNNSSKGDNNSKGGSKGNKNNKGNTIITNDDSKVNNCNSKNDSKVNNCNSNNSNNSNNLHLDELLHRLGASYANTGNLSVIDQILQHVNSGSDDTRRHAVIALGLVIGYNTILIRQIMIPLATSHSMHVRAAAAICLGFFSTETVDESEAATVIGLLEALLFDTEDLVKQQAAIGIGIALQQYNEVDYTNKSSTPNFVRIAKWLNSTIANRVDSKCVKIGASLGRSLMELGGRSAILSIRNMNGQTDPFRVAAFQLMAHTWYWTPLTAIVSALVLPTPCIRLDSGNQTTETTTISTKYRETFVFMDETKRSRRFKRNKKEKIGNITRKHDGELKNMAKINYKDVIRRNRWNMIDWTGDS